MSGVKEDERPNAGLTGQRDDMAALVDQIPPFLGPFETLVPFLNGNLATSTAESAQGSLGAIPLCKMGAPRLNGELLKLHAMETGMSCEGQKSDDSESGTHDEHERQRGEWGGGKRAASQL